MPFFYTENKFFIRPNLIYYTRFGHQHGAERLFTGIMSAVGSFGKNQHDDGRKNQEDSDGQSE